MKNYYEILGVDTTADADEIKKAFREKSKQYHPDKNAGRPEYNQKFIEIKEAYDILSNEELRLKHDSDLFTADQQSKANFHYQSQSNGHSQYNPKNARQFRCQPIRLFEEGFEEFILTWLSDGDYTPDDIIENITVNKNLCFLPFMYMHLKYEGKFDAELGVFRTYYKTVYNYNTKRYEQVSHRELERFYRAHYINDTAHIIGLNQAVGKGTMFEKIEATFQSSPIDSENIFMMDLSSYDESQLLKPKYDQQDLFNIRLKEDLLQKIRRHELSKYHFDRVSYANVNVQFESLGKVDFYVPYWLFLYKYNDQPYYAYVNAFDTKQFGGTRPIDKARKKVVRAINWKYWSIGLGSTLLASYVSLLLFQRYFYLPEPEFNWYTALALVAGLVMTHVLSRKKIKEVKKSSYNIRQDKLKEKLSKL